MRRLALINDFCAKRKIFIPTQPGQAHKNDFCAKQQNFNSGLSGSG